MRRVAILYALVAVKGASSGWLAPIYMGLLVFPFLLIQGLAWISVADSLAGSWTPHLSPI